VNKGLLDTDILSEVGKGINQTVTRNAIAYRHAYGLLKLSVISVMEVIQGYQRRSARSDDDQNTQQTLATRYRRHPLVPKQA